MLLPGDALPDSRPEDGLPASSCKNSVLIEVMDVVLKYLSNYHIPHADVIVRLFSPLRNYLFSFGSFCLLSGRYMGIPVIMRFPLR